MSSHLNIEKREKSSNGTLHPIPKPLPSPGVTTVTIGVCFRDLMYVISLHLNGQMGMGCLQIYCPLLFDHTYHSAAFSPHPFLLTWHVLKSFLHGDGDFPSSCWLLSREAWHRHVHSGSCRVEMTNPPPTDGLPGFHVWRHHLQHAWPWARCFVSRVPVFWFLSLFFYL